MWNTMWNIDESLRTSCATELPWIAHPFRLISWIEMYPFYVSIFLSIARSYQTLIEQLQREDGEAILSNSSDMLDGLEKAEKVYLKMGLTASADALKRLAEYVQKEITVGSMRERLLLFQETSEDEMERNKFFFVPPHRSPWYSKKAETIIGQEWCTRFARSVPEVEEAAKCYAFGRYTAAAFHMSRVTEAGMQALARAIKFTPENNNWNLVFRKLGSEFDVVQKNPQTQWPAHWQTHRDFLETVWADLRAVAKAWRNDIAHLVDTYAEDEAAELLAIIPIFLRDMAAKMNEDGTLY